MKKIYVKDALNLKRNISISGWISYIRDYGKRYVLGLIDSTGILKCTTNKNKIIKILKDLKIGDCVKINGTIKTWNKEKFLEISKIGIVSKNELSINPNPYKPFDIFKPSYAKTFLYNRHLYLVNPKFKNVLRIRHTSLQILKDFFTENGFIEINPPEITQLTYYGEKSAFDIDFWGTKAYLTQCGAYYLEAAILPFEKVFAFYRSFRKEKSKTSRHNAEFLQIKAEMAWANLDDIMKLTEDMIYYLIRKLNEKCSKELKALNVSLSVKGLKPPYPAITYNEALEILKKKGKELEWGKSLGADEERILSKEFEKPFWVKNLPRKVEAFPYEICEENPKLTKTADLLAPQGYGEIVGTAEKIYKYERLIERMKEKGLDPSDERYKWYVELRKFGLPPHSGLGTGMSRILRWLLNLHHVREVIPFPRFYGKKPYP